MDKYHRSKEIKRRLKTLEETHPEITGMARYAQFRILSKDCWLPRWWDSEDPNVFCAYSPVHFSPIPGENRFTLTLGLQTVNAHKPRTNKKR